LGLGIWDLGFGIFQSRQAAIEIGDRLFQHRAMRRGARELEIGKRADSGERERRAFCASGALVRTEPCGLCAVISGRLLLRFD
jgi:hypothetical protein